MTVAQAPRRAIAPPLSRRCEVCCAQAEHERWVEPAKAAFVLWGIPTCLPHAEANVKMVLMVWSSMGLHPAAGPTAAPEAEHDCLVCVEVADEDPDALVYKAAGDLPYSVVCQGHERQYARGLRMHLVESGLLSGSDSERRTYGLPS